MKFLLLFKEDTWVKPFLKKYKLLLLFAIFLGSATFFCGSALMFTSGFLISKAASKPENILLIYVPVVLTRTFGILRPSLRYVERLTSHQWVLKITSLLRKKLYVTLEQEAIFLNEKTKLGNLLALLNEDIGHLQNLYLRSIFPIWIALTLYVIIAIGFRVFDVPLIVFVGILFVLLSFPLVSILKLSTTQDKRKNAQNEAYSTLMDDMMGVNDWIFSGRSQDVEKKHELLQQDLRLQTQAINQFKRRRNFIFEVFIATIACALFIWSAHHWQNQNANYIAAFLLSLFPLIDAFAPLSDAFNEFFIYADSIKRLNQLPEKKEENVSENHPLPSGFDLAIQNISFAHEESQELLLKDFSLTIREKEKLAILGKSGAGKSTLARILRGDLATTSGEVLLGGENIANLSPNIHQKIGVIHQEPYLFHTTLLNNLRMGNLQATEEEIWAALEAVELKDLVLNLPQKLDTVVSGQGLQFSGGERHRLALARILLSPVEIVILDEIFLALDAVTERKLFENIFHVLKDKTVIMITHHLLGIENMDHVLFLENGEIKLYDTPENLKAENTYFQKLLTLDRGL